jgi:hypothetical protein
MKSFAELHEHISEGECKKEIITGKLGIKDKLLKKLLEIPLMLYILLMLAILAPLELLFGGD